MYACHLHDAFSLEANNKLINGKRNWEPRMKGAGEKSGLGFTSATSVTLSSRIFVIRTRSI